MSLAGTVRRSVRTAYKALNDLAGPVTFGRISNSYDPSTGVATETAISYTAEGVFDSYTKEDIDGQLIQASDRRIFLLPNQEDTYEPVIGDKVVGPQLIGWEVVKVVPIQPYDESFVYELQLRK